MRKMECAKDENDTLGDAVSGTFSNGERVEEKFEAERATINNLLERTNTMDKRSKERLTKLMKEHKAELKRATMAAAEDTKAAVAAAAAEDITRSP